MKKKIITICTIICTIICTSCAQEVTIPASDLPGEIKAYVANHFPNQSIKQVIKDKDFLKITYEIILDNMIKLEFNRKNEIKEIVGKIKLPNSVIPNKILTFVNNNYPNNFIISWQLDDNIQKIELDTDLDLKFRSNGDFLRIDN
jgi:hypothetical protein